MDDKIREAFENDNLGDYLRERFPGIGDIELSMSDVIELMEDTYKSRDEEIEEIKGCNAVLGDHVNWQKKEIKKLRDALDKVEYLYVDYQKYGHKDSAPRTVSEMGVIAKQALKDGKK